MTSLRSRPEECISDYAFDRLIAGARGAEEVRAEAHLAQCDRCARRFAELRAEQADFAHAPELKLGKRPPPFFARAPWLGACALALAAATTLFLSFDSSNQTGTRAKGSGLALGLYVKHAGDVRRGAADEPVEPGDAVRFFYSLSEARHIAILSFDGARRATVYYPEGPVAARADPGAQIALPSSTVLDEVIGPETIYGVACPGAFAIEPLRQTLEATGKLAPPAGCDVDTLSLRKEAPSGR